MMENILHVAANGEVITIQHDARPVDGNNRSFAIPGWTSPTAMC
jgi:hypothetical protein